MMYDTSRRAGLQPAWDANGRLKTCPTRCGRLKTCPTRRGGFSLLEVMVALAIFLIGLVGIGQLITMSGDRALEVQQQSQATRLCQSKMAEVVSGVISLTSQAETPFDEDPDWNWSIDAEQQGDAANLWTVKITVTPANKTGRKMETSLTQFVFDPAQRGSTLDITAAAAAAAQAQSSSSSASNGAAGANNSNSGNASQQNTNGNTAQAVGGGAMPAAKTTTPSTKTQTPTQAPTQPQTQPKTTTKSTKGN
jgi:prepilin-type N-terminal cleavage/methylation domain-containing protein